MMKLSLWRQLLATLALGVLAVSPLHAQSTSSSAGGQGSDIAAGIAAYTRAQAAPDRESRLAGFARAQAHFSAAADAGSASADLFANIGTAALQSERLGDAIVAFRRALAIDPDHDRATRNLMQARKLLPEWVPKPASGTVLDSFFFWHHTWSTFERAYGAAWCFLFAAIAFGIGYAFNSRLARALALIPMAGWLGLSVSLLINATSDPPPPAVIVATEVLARASDSSNAPPRFVDPLPAGTEVVVLARRDRWVHIGLANARSGWIPRQALELVNAPQ